jgi:hypothetical protein
MKERFLESFAILLAGLFSAERPRPWRLGDPAPRPKHAGPGDGPASPSNERSEN